MGKQQTKTGRRPDIPHYVRSSWEANFARYLKKEGIPYEYEPKTFYFNQWERRGAMHYTPDFYLTEEDRYIEIKGQMDSVDRTKLKRMAKYYPDIQVELIDAPAYAALEKRIGHTVPNWEFPAKRERDATREKIQKAFDELREANWAVTRDTGMEGIDLIAFNSDEIRFIKVLYARTQTDPVVGQGFLALAELAVPTGVQKELWVYHYGMSGYLRHVI